MSKFRNEFDPEQRGGAEAPYEVGDKKPPLHSRFKRGQSGNPKGRPKGNSDFGAALMRELRKRVAATINGNPFKIRNEELFVAALVKDGITKGPQAKALLMKSIRDQEARDAAIAEARKKVDPWGEVQEFSWAKEEQELYQQLKEVTDRIREQQEHPENEPASPSPLHESRDRDGRA
jgi:hypothetical protein